MPVLYVNDDLNFIELFQGQPKTICVIQSDDPEITTNFPSLTPLQSLVVCTLCWAGDGSSPKFILASKETVSKLYPDCGPVQKPNLRLRHYDILSDVGSQAVATDLLGSTKYTGPDMKFTSITTAQALEQVVKYFMEAVWRELDIDIRQYGYSQIGITPNNVAIVPINISSEDYLKAVKKGTFIKPEPHYISVTCA